MAFFSKLMRSAEPSEEAFEVEEGQVDGKNAKTHNPTTPAQDKTSENSGQAIASEAVAPNTVATNGTHTTAVVTPYPPPQPTEHSGKLKQLIEKILFSNRISDALDNSTEDIKKLFSCKAVSVYSVDRLKRQIASRNHKKQSLEEIRLDIAPGSLAGYVAATGKALNIQNVYDKKELQQYHPQLTFDPKWDQLFKFKSRSVLTIALPHEKRVMGVLQLLNRIDGKAFNAEDVRLAKELSVTLGHAMSKLELEDIQEKIQATSQAIHSAESIDQILLDLQNPILQLFDANLVTIYSINNRKNEIFSKIKSGNTINEIRVSISPASISGCVALEKRSVNIKDVYNQNELKDYHPELTFDDSWDKKSGIRTKTMLVHPLIHEDNVMGVLQLVNKNHGCFSLSDETNAMIVSQNLALAFYNQRKTYNRKPTKFGYMIESGCLSPEELNDAITKARNSQRNIEEIFLDELKLKRKDIGRSLEAYYKTPYSGFNSAEVLPETVFAGLNKNYLAKNNWVPLESNAQRVVILIDDPFNMDKTRNIKMIFAKKEVEFKVGLTADINDFLNMAMTSNDILENEAPAEEMSSLLIALEDEASTSVSFTDISIDHEEPNAISETDSTIVRLVNKILTVAYDQGISDIHIEPGLGKKDIRVRFRKDGICSIYQQIPYLYKQAVVSRIKIMAKLDIAERRLPQDGKIKMKYGNKSIEYRVAICPTVGGNEDAVLRILAASEPIPLEKMMFSPRNLELIKANVETPYGLILTVGPTGSGKTTTLHSCLGHINTPEKKIWTAEDPVEITQDGLRQVQMHSKIGLDFARTMRSFLRGDPDVIMVGEMRDSETAAIGLEASLTGHLVFSTLHTNSAPETIVRLLDMGMNPLNFADALLLVVAQRLVRTLCNDCKKKYQPTKEEFKTLVTQYGEEDFKKLGIKYSGSLKLYKPEGCDKCNDSGYAGRIALHEVLEGTQELKRLILTKALVNELRTQSLKDGMTTLKQDGINKIFLGHTDLKQVLSVCSM
jgi:type II secretory ATPase GspE/PulE/Tfp pilus assembly ATPase PilB-like protein/GAF domain-containing protein